MRSLLLVLTAAPALLLGATPPGSPAYSTPVVLRRLATSLLLALAGLSSFWLAAEALTDPGGWAGLALVAAWTVPMLAVTALAWFRPDRAVAVLAAIAGLFVAGSILGGVFHDWLAEFEDRNGPVQLAVLVAALLPVAVLGVHRPVAAGSLLAVMTLAPIAAALVAGPVGGKAALAVVSAPLLAAAVMLLAGSRTPRSG